MHLNKTFKFSSFRFAKNYLLLANKKILTKDEINNAEWNLEYVENFFHAVLNNECL